MEWTGMERALAKTAMPVAGAQYPGVRDYRRRRWLRVKGREGRANCLHVMSRIVDGLPFFGEEDKDALVVMLFRMAKFCRVKVLTYCVMGNHFHALIEVPDGEKIRCHFRDREKGWERLYSHLGCLYSKAYVAGLKRKVSSLLEGGRLEEVEEIREAFLKRMGDVSRFVWELKERFTKWFNKTHGRRGTLWQGRFKSVLVEGCERSQDDDGGYSQALRTMASYIDLNPVRAGLVEDPAEYRWCGYAAALAGQRRARRGLCQVMGAGTDCWDEAGVAVSYRTLLESHGLGRDSCEEAASEDSLSDLAAKSVPALTRGFAIGEKGFVKEVFGEYREHFGRKRRAGPRELGEGRLYTLRKTRGAP